MGIAEIIFLILVYLGIFVYVLAWDEKKDDAQERVDARVDAIRRGKY